MTPADLRALAKRVESGDATNADVLLAIGWKRARTNFPNLMHNPDGFAQWAIEPLTSLDAVATLWQPLREMGWKIWMDETGSSSEPYWLAQAVKPPELISALGEATTLPRAWLSLLLRCMAAEMEAAHD